MKPCSVYGASQSAFRSGRDTTRAGRLYSDGILKSFANYVTRIDVRGRKGATTTHRTPDFTSESRRFSGRRPLSLFSPSPLSLSLSLPSLALCSHQSTPLPIRTRKWRDCASGILFDVHRRSTSGRTFANSARDSFVRSLVLDAREAEVERTEYHRVFETRRRLSPRGTFAGILNIPV